MNTLPAVSVRHNRHDGNVAPYVSLGRSRPDLPTVPLTPRTAAQILLDRDAAQADRDALESSRSHVLLNGSADDVAALDHRVAVAKIRLDQLELQHAAAVTTEAKARAEHDAEQTRRKALRKQGVKASGEAAKLADRYVVLAKEMAGVLGQLRVQERLIAEANRNLPDDAEPVPPGEPFNGKAGTPTRYETAYDDVMIDRRDGSRAGGMAGADLRHRVVKRVERRVYVPGTLGEPHIPLSHRVTLPSLGRDVPPIWGGIPYPIQSDTGHAA